ncbi:hypothetical protein BGX23_009285 [Mortierella sp. AD031]|nr:hypothetical protein BGX23_009285 [Mortierella sp. AD031]
MDMRVASTSEATQLSTPPASSASSTPSPSNLLVHPGAIRTIQNKATGYCTPPFQPARNSSASVAIFHDGQLHRSFSQSALGAEVSNETSKRRATEDPLGRRRAQTYSRERPQSMFISSNPQSHSAFLQQDSHQTFGTVGTPTPRDPSGSDEKQDRNEELRTPRLSDAAHANSFNNNNIMNSGSTDNTIVASESSISFWDNSEDVIEPESNKRPRSELRGVEGRKARSATWSNLKTSYDRRQSTNSFIGLGNLSVKNNDGLIDDLPKTPVPPRRAPAEFKVWEDKEQTPVKKGGPRRAPLTDISLSIGTSTMPAVTFDIRPLGPLMTRQPRKASTRSRLVVVSPFPMNQSYWDEYASDTFNYLLEIEGRYDRYMYIDLQSEFGDHRSTLIQWMIELCYGWFHLPSGTLHSAVNILDRYLAIVKPETIDREKLQCVGMCALMIAGKLEEPAGTLSTYNLCQLCDLYSTRELANTEVDILKALKFEILVASATGFSDYFKRAIFDSDETRELIDFLCDLSLISHHFLEFNTCQIAAAAVWISLCAVGQDWNEDLAILTGYSRNDLSPCSLVFHELVFSKTNPLDVRPTLGFKYQVDHVLVILRGVLDYTK